MKYIITIIAAFILSCSANRVETKQPKTTEIETGPTVEGVWVCEDLNGNTLQCESDSDCCSGGFSCIPDRSLGKNVKVCVWDPE